MSYHHQSSDQVEAYVKYVKHHQKCLDTNNDVKPGLLQIGSKPIVTDLPIPATLLFNRPIRGLLPHMQLGTHEY